MSSGGSTRSRPTTRVPPDPSQDAAGKATPTEIAIMRRAPTMRVPTYTVERDWRPRVFSEPRAPERPTRTSWPSVMR